MAKLVQNTTRPYAYGTLAWRCTMTPRRRLRSIPPTTHSRRFARSDAQAASGETAWRPHIVAPRPPPSSGLSRQEVLACLQRQIDDLTHEIACWLPEFGEAALGHLFETRAWLGDMLHHLTETDT